jgi:arabinose-5-phosphate isomerase
MSETYDLDLARSVVRTERDALDALEASLDTRILDAANLILATDRHTIVAGVGKSGHIAQKIAASLASTGTPAFFLHPTEASHGDLGMVTPGSVVIAISYSGESRELIDLLRFCRNANVPVIAMTRGLDSTLSRAANVLLRLPDVPEACPNGLAPTSSTTMALALGDALTILLMAKRGFSREDFGVRHPGGKLGRTLQTAGDYVREHQGTPPLIAESDPVSRVLIAVSEGRKGCVGVIDGDGRLTGMITDGDLRRAMMADKLGGTAKEVMTPNPRTVAPQERMSVIIKRLSEHRISNAFVVDDARKPIGLIDLKDLIAEGYL